MTYIDTESAHDSTQNNTSARGFTESPLQYTEEVVIGQARESAWLDSLAELGEVDLESEFPPFPPLSGRCWSCGEYGVDRKEQYCDFCGRVQ